MADEKILIAIFAGALAIGAMVLFFSLASQPDKLENTPSNYAQLTSKENPDDICAVPAGTDPEEWKQHLGHHPDKYAQCLE
ncbi:MAG TPA: hypothetical protein HA254_04960 [Candidatus Diapherotrites archaeon]|uniref:Uncharacterized protein n=1 Tax=Candidatus Iainarchaeum sp. TaxID=3101447 RepID=A0A7J4J0I2_9ARCH|nr:hypothetical protein [Candidatus Diapherotrites archaeon]